MTDSSNWTKLQPEVNSTDADAAPAYSLQSEAGHFECSNSGLRWVCQEKANFQYHFCSWEGHMQRMETKQFMPAGPIIDVAVTAGKLNEVHLPHWIHIDDIPNVLDKFAVLHMDDCGDFLEKVSEITPSHVKLTEPTFFPKAVVMKLGPPVEISCNVLIYYKPYVPFLKFRVYLIQHDPALEQKVDKEEISYGFEKIIKPRPDKPLKMQRGFSLTADTDLAHIQPQKITLRCMSQYPNFYEVYIENLDRSFNLKLLYAPSKKHEPVLEPVWTCELKKDDHPKSGYGEAVGSSRRAAVVRTSAVEKHSLDELSAEVPEGSAAITREKLLEMLEHLKNEELEKFKWVLSSGDVGSGLPRIPNDKLENADRLDLVDLLLQTYTQQSVDVTKEVFKKFKTE